MLTRSRHVVAHWRPGPAASGYARDRWLASSWPGRRSGRKAEWLTDGQPWDHAFGPGSPLARLVQADGQILMLGAPPEAAFSCDFRGPASRPVTPHLASSARRPIT